MFETGSRAHAFQRFTVTCPAHAQKRSPAQQSRGRSDDARTRFPIPRAKAWVGGRRTTIVLEAYVWDSIDSMLDREGVSLDTFCADVDDTRLHSSMASSAGLVVLAYFRLLEQINSPPFVDPELQRLGREGALRAPAAARPPVPLLQLALRRFAQDEARVE